MKHLVLYLFFFFCSALAAGQTCCSAGAPVSSIFAIADGEQNSLAVNLAYEYKSINWLIDQDSRLTNDPRTRFGQSVTMKIDYVLNPKWSFSILAPLVHQSRQTISAKESSIGIGDLVLLAQHLLTNKNDYRVNLTAGIKMPTGMTNHRGDSQIFLSQDMQSGSGSFDFISKVNLTKRNFLFPFFSSTFEALYRKNGVNDSFGSTDTFAGRSFAFGDEFNAILTFNYQWNKASGFYTPDFGIKYRWTDSNKEQTVDAPNSGGIWFSIPLGLTFQPTEQKSIRLYTELPFYQKLEGLQITTNFTAGVQLRYIFNRPTKNKIDKINPS